MDIKNYLVKTVDLTALLVKWVFKSIGYTILFLFGLYFLIYSAALSYDKAQESFGFFMFSCSIFVFLAYRFMTRKDKKCNEN
jgi:ABC-type multidrug transport system fused ATPase/permease subunit